MCVLVWLSAGSGERVEGGFWAWGLGAAVDLDWVRAWVCVGLWPLVLPLEADGADLATSFLDSLPWNA